MPGDFSRLWLSSAHFDLSREYPRGHTKVLNHPYEVPSLRFAFKLR